MNKTILSIILLVFVVGVIGFFWHKPANAPDLVTNEQMLNNGNNTPIVGEEVEYYAGAKGYFVRPQGEQEYPGIVMIHENRGLRPEIKAMAEQLAKEGYAVLAVDLFNGKVVDSQDEARALTAQFNQQTGTANMRAATKFLRDRGSAKIASLGWCFGGRQSIELAISGEKLDATVVYYGGGMATTTAQLAPIKWPVMGVFGDKDQVIPMETVMAFTESLTDLGIENEIYVYPNVGHAFANPSGMNYAPEETKDAWAKTVEFLDEHLR